MLKNIVESPRYEFLRIVVPIARLDGSCYVRNVRLVTTTIVSGRIKNLIEHVTKTALWPNKIKVRRKRWEREKQEA